MLLKLFVLQQVKDLFFLSLSSMSRYLKRCLHRKRYGQPGISTAESYMLNAKHVEHFVTIFYYIITR